MARRGRIERTLRDRGSIRFGTDVRRAAIGAVFLLVMALRPGPEPDDEPVAVGVDREIAANTTVEITS